MQPTPPVWHRSPVSFTLFCTLGVAATIAVAARRNRQFAVFALVLVGVQALVTATLEPALPFPRWALYWSQIAVFLHISSLSRPALRPPIYRALVSVPAMFWTAGAFLAIPWAVFSLFGELPAPWIAWAVAGLGILESLHTRQSVVDITLDGSDAGHLREWTSPAPEDGRPLRVVQITDPHLGPFMSVARLRRIAQRAVDAEPDLILLTGDFLTMESKGTPGALAESFEPLRAMEGRVFACRGNHDLEAPQMVAEELGSVGVRLLIDEAACVATPAGPVQIVGVDYRWRERAKHHAAVCERFPRKADHLRLVLLHDPGAFKHLPEGAADLVLSGHTHGGQVGLVTLGLRWTFVRQFTGMPDHGLWARGSDRLYVHRGTGHYGFPLRVGVPAEEGVIQVWRSPA